MIINLNENQFKDGDSELLREACEMLGRYYGSYLREFNDFSSEEKNKVEVKYNRCKELFKTFGGQDPF